MSLSKKSITTLFDLVENRLSSMQVVDRDDARELAVLEAARRELLTLATDQGCGKVVQLRRSAPVEEAAASA